MLIGEVDATKELLLIPDNVYLGGKDKFRNVFSVNSFIFRT